MAARLMEDDVQITSCTGIRFRGVDTEGSALPSSSAPTDLPPTSVNNMDLGNPMPVQFPALENVARPRPVHYGAIPHQNRRARASQIHRRLLHPDLSPRQRLAFYEPLLANFGTNTGFCTNNTVNGEMSNPVTDAENSTAPIFAERHLDPFADAENLTKPIVNGRHLGPFVNADCFSDAEFSTTEPMMNGHYPSPVSNGESAALPIVIGPFPSRFSNAETLTVREPRAHPVSISEALTGSIVDETVPVLAGQGLGQGLMINLWAEAASSPSMTEPEITNSFVQNAFPLPSSSAAQPSITQPEFTNVFAQTAFSLPSSSAAPPVPMDQREPWHPGGLFDVTTAQAFLDSAYSGGPSDLSLPAQVQNAGARSSAAPFASEPTPASSASPFAPEPPAQTPLARTPPPLPRPKENKFRFHCTLDASTAMISHPDEIPVTYLNKAPHSTYKLHIVDTQPPSTGMKYRTQIRVTFEDGKYRKQPENHWGLWKLGRGSSQAQQRGRELHAIEMDRGESNPQIELESQTLDGFSFLWTPTPNGRAECSLTLLFNFLSTDFSLMKGVKGAPMRLCARTTVLADASAATNSLPETCYCIVKLFRDHGAERKLGNDKVHVERLILKHHQQLEIKKAAEEELGNGKGKKRKRAMSDVEAGCADMGLGAGVNGARTAGGKVNGGGKGNGGARKPSVEDIESTLASLKGMPNSIFPVTTFLLTGEELDDPDLYPVVLSEGPLLGLGE